MSNDAHELPEPVEPEVLREELDQIAELVAASDEKVEDVAAAAAAELPAQEQPQPDSAKPAAKKAPSTRRRPKDPQPARPRKPVARTKPAAEAAVPEAAPATPEPPPQPQAAKPQETSQAAKPQKETKEKQPKPKRERRSLKLTVPKPKVALPKPKVSVPKPRLELPKLGLAFARRRRGGHGVKRLVGLKIGASQLAAAHVANKGSAELLQLARTSLERGVVVGGELRDPEKLTEALRTFFKEHDLPRVGVRLGVANNRIGVRTFEIVGITDSKQLDNAVRFRAQETLPIPIEEAVLDYQVLSDEIGPDNLSVKQVLLVVAYRESIDRYVDACRAAGIELVGIDLDAFALLRAMSAPRETVMDAAVVVVAIGHERSTFALSNGKTCEFTRVLEWGGNALDVALVRALDAAPSEAETVKHALDLGATTPPPGLTDVQLDAAKDAVRRQIQSFARELASSLQFYQNQPGSLSIGEIVLTGGTSHLQGMATELQHLIGVTVRVGDPLMRVRVGKKAIADGEQQIGSLATAIGLGIED